ncbi:hypothetical protein DPEC_G00117190 [Dallia pectoralis]|uniref:Uncharacterized protein n=1 Tax=Dallia pectoralis TaxID=75939 RepID=A0ACC2GUE9_DALPE|nr:hypothetical protein DPEC_G00117190 [Dallia pectoralis]
MREVFCGDLTPLTLTTSSPLPTIGTPPDPRGPTSSHGPPRDTRGGCTGGVKLRIKNRFGWRPSILAPSRRHFSWVTRLSWASVQFRQSPSKQKCFNTSSGDK